MGDAFSVSHKQLGIQLAVAGGALDIFSGYNEECNKRGIIVSFLNFLRQGEKFHYTYIRFCIFDALLTNTFYVYYFTDDKYKDLLLELVQNPVMKSNKPRQVPRIFILLSNETNSSKKRLANRLASIGCTRYEYEVDGCFSPFCLPSSFFRVICRLAI